MNRSWCRSCFSFQLFNLLRIVSRFIFIDGFFLDILLLLVLELYVTIRDIITLYEPLWWFVTSSIVIVQSSLQDLLEELHEIYCEIHCEIY